MKIALDAYGGDFGLAPNIEGALDAAGRLGCHVALVGDEAALKSELKRRGQEGDPSFSVVNAPGGVIGMEQEPAIACREKPDSSIMVCADMVARGDADAMVSMGNSGATAVAALFKLGRLPGVSRPAIALFLPTKTGQVMLLDAGAITDAKPHHLLQYAHMASIYLQKARGVESPSVGILSVGEEENKGNLLVKETFPLLKASGLNFRGCVEGRDIPAGTVDIIVCDGFVGNICLKLAEGMAKTIFQIIKEAAARNPVYLLGGLLLKGALKDIKAKTDPDATGGAPLLGVDGVAIIGHGKSSARGVANALSAAMKFHQSGVNDAIKQAMARIESEKPAEAGASK
ncbi:MAG: phosphate acyltransferase PlsX [Elusimicrobia bacterium]|nr:phosphate acyltransferase PlsX [Elusimicrobiota bacterium]